MRERSEVAEVRARPGQRPTVLIDRRTQFTVLVFYAEIGAIRANEID